GPATQATLDAPTSLAVDSTGNLYIADAYADRVRRVTPGGVITTIAGTGHYNSSGDGGLATAAELGPVAVAVDRSDNVYVADIAGGNIRKITRDGRISSLAGTFERPVDLGFDQAGNLYFAETYQFRSGEGAARVRVMTTDGTFRTLATNFGGGLRIT